MNEAQWTRLLSILDGELITTQGDPGLTRNDYFFDPDGDPETEDGFLLHLSCSDPFTGGWGQSGGPDECLNPDWQIDYYLGSALSLAERYREAIDPYRRALSANPDSVKARFRLGNPLAAAGDLDEAKTAWQAILESHAEFIAARLNLAGIKVTVATNQSGIGRGIFALEDLNQMHAKFQRALARVGGHVDGIFFCPHAPEANCSCRKPAPGLLRSIGHRFGVPLTEVPVIGDSRRDIEAALAVRARPMLVRSGKGAQTLQRSPELADYPVFDDLAGAVDRLLSGDRLA